MLAEVLAALAAEAAAFEVEMAAELQDERLEMAAEREKENQESGATDLGGPANSRVAPERPPAAAAAAADDFGLPLSAEELAALAVEAAEFEAEMAAELEEARLEREHGAQGD
jgi:hypothetical protein